MPHATPVSSAHNQYIKRAQNNNAKFRLCKTSRIHKYTVDIRFKTIEDYKEIFPTLDQKQASWMSTEGICKSYVTDLHMLTSRLSDR